MDEERTVGADGGVAQSGASPLEDVTRMKFPFLSPLRWNHASPWPPPSFLLPLLRAAMTASRCFGSGPRHRQRRPGYMSAARASSCAAFKDTVRKRSNARAGAARLRPRSLLVPFKFWTLGAARWRKWCASGNGQPLNQSATLADD